MFMSWLPLLNNEPYTFTTEDLPALIHGEKGAGSSLFALGLLSQLYFQGEPLFIISSDDDTKTEFLRQTNAEDKTKEVTDEIHFSDASHHQVIHIASDYDFLIPQLLTHLEDYEDRIVFINTFNGLHKDMLALFYGHAKTIYVGDLNSSEAKEPLLQLKYMAKIFFSPLLNDFRLTLPKLEKYHGYYQGRTDTGTVTLQQTHE